MAGSVNPASKTALRSTTAPASKPCPPSPIPQTSAPKSCAPQSCAPCSQGAKQGAKHKRQSQQGPKQGYRFPGRDYRMPAFYMITMTAHDRRPRFGVCANNRCILNEDGWLVYETWNRMALDYPAIRLSTLMIMPDHLHGIVRVTEHMEKPVGVPLRAFKSQVTSALRKRYDNPALQVWRPGYHDWAVWRRGALKAFTHYILDNPRRYCLRKAHPDLFRRVNNLRRPNLPDNETWTGYGNLFLLDKPERIALQVSRRISPEALDALRAETLERVRNGATLISPFISPGEKDIARAALDAGGSVILMKPDGFHAYFKPAGSRYFDLCQQGRLLILACRPPASAATPVTRELCLAMNRWCAAIASLEEIAAGKAG
jgi:REP element-mobilizing transposase RayT